LLIPGIGAQGGDLNEVVKNGINKDVGLLINSSRGIIYAGSEKDFELKARNSAQKLQLQMASFL
jgi:orotidine-5'-phosphate decarboxylase